MNYKDIYMIGVDLGRFMYTLDNEMSQEKKREIAHNFVNTFNTYINLENLDHMEQFFQGIGYGFSFASHE